MIREITTKIMFYTPQTYLVFSIVILMNPTQGLRTILKVTQETNRARAKSPFVAFRIALSVMMRVEAVCLYFILFISYIEIVLAFFAINLIHIHDSFKIYSIHQRII